ncbi:hypothetical protein NL108_000699 [Boleophthalmus pectinirostris]|nr:hypothetical protein NL108_000699 [Boleophthalmus pectinirostris]
MLLKVTVYNGYCPFILIQNSLQKMTDVIKKTQVHNYKIQNNNTKEMLTTARYGRIKKNKAGSTTAIVPQSLFLENKVMEILYNKLTQAHLAIATTNQVTVQCQTPLLFLAIVSHKIKIIMKTHLIANFLVS